MKEITLANSDIKAIVSDSHYEWAISYKWKLSPEGYVWRWNKATRSYKMMHREILKSGPQNSLTVSDHINGIRHDNRVENLRTVTRSQNAVNSTKKEVCTSQYKGVTFNRERNKWKAMLIYGGRSNTVRCYLGDFEREEDAALAYDRKARAIHGEFAKLNFPATEETVTMSPK